MIFFLKEKDYNIFIKFKFNQMGIGDWGLGIGPNPQSPIPNPQSPLCCFKNVVN